MFFSIGLLVAVAGYALYRGLSVPEQKPIPKVTYQPNPRTYDPVKREVTDEVIEKIEYEIIE